MKFLILNGPNLNLLGVREPDIYGKRTYADLVCCIEAHCAQKGVACEIRQSNHEGVLVDLIQEALGRFDAIILNPAAYTHTSVAILDALKAVRIPAAEVHLSDVDKREPFRAVSYAGLACVITRKGKGFDSYLEAIDDMIKYLNHKEENHAESENV